MPRHGAFVKLWTWVIKDHAANNMSFILMGGLLLSCAGNGVICFHDKEEEGDGVKEEEMREERMMQSKETKTARS